jgi:hypothetical protein
VFMVFFHRYSHARENLEIGLRSQFKVVNSRIAEKVMLDLMEEGIVVLRIADRVRTWLDHTWKLSGPKIGKQKDGIR